MRKKVMITLIAAMTVTGMLAGCSQTEEPTENVSVETSEQTEDETTEENTQGEAGSSSFETDSADTSGSPAVYMTTDISSEGLIAVYEALQASPEGNSYDRGM